MKDYKNHHKPGFTIVELTLAMSFVGVLLVTIAIIVLNIIAIYQKGLSIRAVNSVGRELVNEFARAIEAAPIKNIPSFCKENYTEGTTPYNDCIKDNGHKFIYQQNTSSTAATLKTENAITDADKVSKPPTHGAFCTGRYTFIWNTGYVLNSEYGISDKKATFTYKVGSNTTTIEDFRLLRVADENRTICKKNVNSNYKLKSTGKYNVGTISSKDMVAELLDISDDNLALYDLQVFVPTQHHITMHSYYSGTFILATLQGNINIKTTGNFCNTVPDDLNTDFAYCAINKFNFAAQATGGLNENEQKQQRGN